MSDQLVRLHLKGPELLVVGLLGTGTARRASGMHRCLPTSAALFGQAIAAGAGVASLLGAGRINLQVICDGPIKGLFVDADTEGNIRGYLKNAVVSFLQDGPRVEAAPALGGSGTLSVLRELRDGAFYRGSVSLEAFDLGRDLERYYRESEQIETIVALDVLSEGEQPLGQVVGLFVQKLPDAEDRALDQVRAWIGDRPLLEVLRDPPQRAFDVVRPLVDRFEGGWELLAEYPLAYECGCSSDRVLRAVMAMGRGEIEDLLREEGRARATCAFCGTSYEVSGEQLQQILDQAG